MNQTNNYQLSQWDPEDRILRTDFNSDNAKTDAALADNAAAVAALTAQLAAKGNCRIVYGEYAGNGNYGKNAPNSLTFSHQPVLVIIQAKDQISTNHDRLIFLRGASWGYSFYANPDSHCYVTWSGNTIRWYNIGSAMQQENQADTTYVYVALTSAD